MEEEEVVEKRRRRRRWWRKEGGGGLTAQRFGEKVKPQRKKAERLGKVGSGSSLDDSLNCNFIYTHF